MQLLQTKFKCRQQSLAGRLQQLLEQRTVLTTRKQVLQQERNHLAVLFEKNITGLQSTVVMSAVQHKRDLHARQLKLVTLQLHGVTEELATLECQLHGLQKRMADTTNTLQWITAKQN